jgi:hypothetical protein
MTMLIWSLVWFALFMLGALVYLPEVDEVTGWKVAGVCICSFACLVLSICSFGMFLWPVFSGIGAPW